MQIIREEMRRVVAFHRTKAAQWRNRATICLSISTPGGPGHISYGLRQADVLEAMGSRCVWMWEECRGQADDFLLSHNIPPDLELRVLDDDRGDEALEAAQSMSANAGGGDDETWHDEDQWGVTTAV